MSCLAGVIHIVGLVGDYSRDAIARQRSRYYESVPQVEARP